MPKCVVPSCQYKNSYHGIKRSFFKCQGERARLWEKIIPGIDILKASDYICDAHFDNSQKTSRIHPKNGPHYVLSKEALPKIFSNSINVLDKNPSSYSPNLINDAKSCIGESSLQHVVQEMAKAEQMLSEIKTEVFNDVDDTKIKIENQSAMEIKITPYEELRINLDKYASGLPDSWRVSTLLTGSDEVFIFSKECTVSHNLTLLILIEKNVVLNSNNELHYSIHGKSIDCDHLNLPNTLVNIEALLGIIILFNSVSVCQGVLNNKSVSDEDEFVNYKIYKDNLGYWRHVSCVLATSKLYCHHCYYYKEYLLETLNNINNIKKNKVK